MTRWLLTIAVFLLIACSLSGATAWSTGSGCTASPCVTGSASVTAGDAIVICGIANLAGASATFADSAINVWTAIGVPFAAGTSTNACAFAIAKSTGSYTGQISWSGSPTKMATVFGDTGTTYTTVDQNASASVAVATCVNLNSNNDCPPLAGDRTITLTHPNEILVAYGAYVAAAGTWCATPSNCGDGNGNTYALQSGSSVSNADGSVAIGYFTTTSGTTGTWGASMFAGSLRGIMFISLYTKCVPTLKTLGVSSCG